MSNFSGLNSGINIVASALSAETIRMNTIASNLANANSVGSSEAATYHAKHPVFSTILSNISGLNPSEQAIGGVMVQSITNGNEPLKTRYEPNNPMANKQGYIHETDVNPIHEMTDMIDSSRHYQALIEVANAEKGLVLQTIRAIDDR